MKTIIREADFTRCEGIPDPVLLAAKACFHELRSASPAESLGLEFILDSGPIFLIERSDSKSELSQRLGPWIEWATAEQAPDNGVVRVYHAVSSWDNDMLPHFFGGKGDNPDFERLILPYLELSSEEEDIDP